MELNLRKYSLCYIIIDDTNRTADNERTETKLTRTAKIISIIIIAAFFVIALSAGIAELGGGVKNLFGGKSSFENDAVTLKNTVLYDLFGVSGNEQVISGKEDWLFFNKTINDYTGAGTLSDSDIARITGKLSEINDYCRRNGAGFTVVVVPNKNEIYSEYMPSVFEKHDAPANLDKLLSSLAEAGIDAPDLRKLFDGREGLYYKTDTHWNAKGAAILADLIFEKYVPGNNFRYSECVPSASVGFTGDLYKLVFPSSTALVKSFAEKSYLFTESPGFRYIDLPVSLMDMEIETESDNADSGSLLVYRDSFGSELVPLLSGQFSHARYLRGNKPYDLSYIETDKPEAVIIVIAQRNIPELLTSDFSGI